MRRTTAKGCGRSTSLSLYLREIKDDPLLSAEEERDLADAIARGDHPARARLIRSNLRLVIRIARNYVRRGLTIDDLVGEGNLGLIRAVEEYDPRFGTRFSTYAAYWIKESILRALINTTATIRLPSYMVTLLTKWRRAERSLRRDRGRAPTFDDIASHLGLTEVQESLVARAMHVRQLRLESGLTTEANLFSLDELTYPFETPLTSLESGDETDAMLRHVDRLDGRGRTVLALRYGLDGEEPLSLKQVGVRLGMTHEGVRKIQVSTLARLRSEMATGDRD